MARISAYETQWLGLTWWVQEFNGAHDTAYSNHNYSFNLIQGGMAMTDFMEVMITR